MSERPLLLILALLVAARPGMAQTVPQLEHRLRLLQERREAVVDSIARRSDRIFEDQPREVVFAGPVPIAYPAWAAANARASLPKVAPVWLERYGAALDTLLRDTITIGLDPTANASTRGTVIGEWRLGALRSEVVAGLGPDVVYDWITVVPTEALGVWERSLLDTTMRAWLGRGLRGQSAERLLDGSVRDLVASPSAVAHRCLGGRVEECARVLDLSGPSESLTRWYDLPDIAAFADRIATESWARGRSECVNRHDLDQCRALLRRNHFTPPRPTNDRVRAGFYAFAIVTGGEGAFLRVHRAAGRSVAEQLEAAAQLPLDTLLVRWHAALRADRGHAQGDLTPILMVALAWAVGTTLFFSWRFRWRHV
ncbi:MAG: hypothetical protein ABIQ41_06590 [Gemmatimonadales bacterium]